MSADSYNSVLKINARRLVFLAQFNPSVVRYPPGAEKRGSLPYTTSDVINAVAGNRFCETPRYLRAT